MRILRFEIKNDKAITSWIHDANGEHVAISGQTGTGKTTAASALWEIAEKSKDCLTHGEHKGYITVHLGEGKVDLIATREFTPNSNTIKVERADGTKVSAADFKAMISVLSENPHKIAEMKPTERVKTLLGAADLGDVDLMKMDEEIAGAERVRLDAGRRAEDFVPGLEPEKAEPVDVSAISEELEANHIHNDMIDQDQREIDAIVEEGQRINVDIIQIDERRVNLLKELDGLAARVAELGTQHISLTTDYKARVAAHDGLTLEDNTELKAKLATATEVNEKAGAYKQWEARTKEYDDLKQQRACADETVKELREYKKELLDGAEWPLEGLSIEDGEVMYNEALFDNLGQSEQMLVCAALAIKDILAHELHCVRMDGVESMSEKDFKTLQELFGDHGVQCISTRVARGDVEDGELVITEKEEK